MRPDFHIAGHPVKAGTKTCISVPLPSLHTNTELCMPVHVYHGKKDGPVLFVTAAIHGDEVNGVEIIRRLLERKGLQRLHGTLVAVPVVNTYGLIQQSRYLPDRRDLNRSFPGSQKGSLAARLAYLLMTDILSTCTHGIDLHTGAVHRSNLPQIRADLDHEETRAMAEAFGAPVLLNANLRDGSLRSACKESNIPVLLYEAGEALRYDEVSIRGGVNGIINVMRTLKMLPASRRKTPRLEPAMTDKSLWMRATSSGMMRAVAPLGAEVKVNTVLGYINDPHTGNTESIVATRSGIVIGRLELPMVYEGDAVFHIACFGKDERQEAVEQVESFNTLFAEDEFSPQPLNEDST